jgi:DNA gyrase subunit A
MAKQTKFNLKDDFIENIIEKPLEQLMPDSMMPYSEYVILDRALPRVEDGLKPVQRRILYTLHSMNMKPEGPFVKSARVVGECMGKYHPHGDKSVYDAMVRMAQDFNMRLKLVHGHGNFGSIDGDPAAAMRYTEVKLEKLATELLKDIEQGTVKWNKNFDDSLDEPDVLPGRFPNLLVNGASGIAIGLATNIPTHNLTEVIDGTVALIDQPSIKLVDLVKIVKGPDFPTGGFMLGGKSILDMYETGHGKVVLRARIDIENADNDRQNIVVTEIPYNVNKEALQKRIFDLKEAKKEILGNIQDVADESDKNGMRIVIKLKKGEDAAKIINYLTDKTDLQCNFNVNMVAIAGGKPKQMGLVEILRYYIEFQREVVLNRSKHRSSIAKKREHILEGYTVAIPNIDRVIAIIRAADSRAEARGGLRQEFNLSHEQAEAVLNLPLGSINKLDVAKYEKELKELKAEIEKLTKIISSQKEQLKVVRHELLEIRDRYKTKRLTAIIDDLSDLDIKAYDPTKRQQKSGIIALDAEGGVKLLSARAYSAAERDLTSGGEASLTTALIKTEADETALIFGDKGNCYKADAEILKEKRWTDAGSALEMIYDTATDGEKARAVVAFKTAEADKKELYIYTKLGYVKRSPLKQYLVNKDVYQAIVLKDGDEVIGAEVKDEDANIIFVTSDGNCINTTTEDYALQGRIAGGVIGANLNDKQHVVYAGQTTYEAVSENGKTEFYPLGELVVLTSNGFAKRVITSEFESMKRNRKGVRIIDLQGDNAVVFANKVLEPYEIGATDNTGELNVIDTESIMLNRRDTRGRQVLFGKKVIKAAKHVPDLG